MDNMDKCEPVNCIMKKLSWQQLDLLQKDTNTAAVIQR